MRGRKLLSIFTAACSLAGSACRDRRVETLAAPSVGRASSAVSPTSLRPPYRGEQMEHLFDASHVLPAYSGPRVRSIVGSCAILVDGDVRCFEHPPPAGANAKPSAAGYYSDGNDGCFVATDGTVWCWGKVQSHVHDPRRYCHWQPWPPRAADVAADEDEDRQCPSIGGFYYCGFDQICEKPVRLTRLDRVVSLVGAQERCALRQNGEVWCWGEVLEPRAHSQRCRAPAGAQNTTHLDICRDPERVPGLPPLASINLDGPACGLTQDGRLFCWGHLPEQFSRRAPEDSADPSFSEPAEQTKWPRLKQLASIGRDTCGITLEGEVVCQRFRAPAPTPAPGFEGAQELAAGLFLTCFTTRQREVSCSVPRGPNDWTSPVKVPGLHDVVQVSVEHDRGCAVLRDGAAYCWGNRRYRGEHGYFPPVPAFE